MSNTVLKFPLPKTKRSFRHWSLQLFLGSDIKYHRVPSRGLYGFLKPLYAQSTSVAKPILF
jgi:hypothetical protein